MVNYKLAGQGGTIIYVGDPMCSWCWGIANHLTKLVDTYSGQLNFEIVMGGLRPGGGTPWNKQMKDFLRHHWEEVHKRSGQPFSYGIFDLPYFNYDTEPPSRAVVIAKEMFPGIEFDFFKLIQHAFYVENGDPNDIQFYKPICEALKIPFPEFSNLFDGDLFKERVKNDFLRSHQMGIRGFPSVVYQRDGAIEQVTNGYASFDDMNRRVQSLISQNIITN